MLNSINFEAMSEIVSNQMYKSATLFPIGMPIGNMADITLRALHVLTICDRVAAENIRHSQVLLNRYHISKPMISLNEHNELKHAQKLIEYLMAGERIALITDAGTPGISDPGGKLVSLVRKSGINIVPIPGPSALITAVSIVGFCRTGFIFHGFLPRKINDREKFLSSIAHERYTHIFYEAPHRIFDMLTDCLKYLGSNRRVLVAKELTKIHETSIHGSLSEVVDFFACKRQRGEFVVIIEGTRDHTSSQENEQDNLLMLLLKELPLSQAVRLFSEATGKEKKVVYKKALEMKNNFLILAVER